jgi:hypothetical protein
MRGWHEKVLRDAVGAAAGAAAASAGAAPRLRLISPLITQLTSGAAPLLQLTLEVFLVRNGVACSPNHLTSAGQRRALTCGISRHNGALWRASRRLLPIRFFGCDRKPNGRKRKKIRETAASFN